MALERFARQSGESFRRCFVYNPLFSIGPRGRCHEAITRLSVARYFFLIVDCRVSLSGFIRSSSENLLRNCRRQRRWGRSQVSWNSLRGAACRRPAMEAAHACGEMGGGPEGHRVRSALPARPSLRRYEFSRQRRQRRLPHAECLDPCENGRQENAGDGLDLWRRLRGWKHLRGSTGRHASGAARRVSSFR